MGDFCITSLMFRHPNGNLATAFSLFIQEHIPASCHFFCGKKVTQKAVRKLLQPFSEHP